MAVPQPRWRVRCRHWWRANGPLVRFVVADLAWLAALLVLVGVMCVLMLAIGASIAPR